ncbi:oxidase [Metallosphaera tengchongensis]|uniref:Oxidase n=1 Tax=Metallosphaera tengchongensis TaxID=1532350 RepID=A0A6N0NSB4_9CREN|nr:oxidase [Metallosphaera tengchongensis]QKQ99645.1 oxidase [Metallosphaera tengchongensis]
MDKKEKYELAWALFVIVLFAVVIVGTLPQDFLVGGVPSSLSPIKNDPANVIYTRVVSSQYVFQVRESGAINALEDGSPSLYNLIIAHPGDWLNLTMTSSDVTENFYFPDYAGQVIDDQIVPGLVTYDALKVPNLTGPYVFLNGEYNGPWFSYQTGELLVIPQSGYFTSSSILTLSQQDSKAQTSGLVGDPYNPPILNVNGPITLVTDKYGLFNDSVPGPTLVVKAGNQVTLNLIFSTPNSDHNYLYNYSVSGQASPVTDVNVGIYAVWWNGTITPVIQKPITYGTPITFTFNATAPAYVYGIVTPVFNNYNPNGMSNNFIGQDKGLVMGAWGTILVTNG